MPIYERIDKRQEHESCLANYKDKNIFDQFD